MLRQFICLKGLYVFFLQLKKKYTKYRTQQVNSMLNLKAAGGFVLLGLAVFSSTSLAHHSRVNFVMDTLLDLEGVITDYSYRNPHIYLTIDVENEEGSIEEWLLEANAVSTLKKVGWTADSFKVGERIQVQVNPDRDPSKRVVFVDNIKKSDGTNLVSSGLPPGGENTVSTEPVGSSDFSGVWQPDFASRDIAAGFRPANLPLTAAGQAVMDYYNENDDPALDCEPESMPSTILPVFPVRFSRILDNQIHIWYEEFDGFRIVYMDMDGHPADIKPNLMGHSIGTITDNVLEIDTIGFRETVWGLGRGAPSGEQKHIIERYELSADGMKLGVEYWFEDPEFLAAPMTVTGELLLKPGYEFEAWACDPDAARRHLH